VKKTLYIHFGTVKTGTTAIQRFLSSNDKILSKHGFHYPGTLRCKDGSHNPLVWILYHKYCKMHLNIYSQPYVVLQNRLLTDLATEIDSTFEHSILLSSEILYLLSEEAIDEFLSLFDIMTVKAIFYVRDLREVSISLAAQIVKLQESRTNDERISYIYDNHINHFFRCYIRCIQFLERKIGKKNLIFRKYGTEYFKHGNIYDDVLDSIGINITDEFIKPDKLQNESLVYCESVYFKDLLNRLVLRTPQNILVEQLLAWEKSNQGTKFFLPKDTSIKIEKQATKIHKYLLENYLDASYEEFFDREILLNKEAEYKLSHSDFESIFHYLDSRIANFKDDFMESLALALDRTYEYELKRRVFEEMFTSLIQDKKAVALWGCGDISEKLFAKHDFLRGGSFYVIDKNLEKHGAYLGGHEILPQSIINDKGIDTVIITSTRYADEIIKEIIHEYPCVRYIIKLADLNVQIGLECLDLRTDEGMC
jgi:hypothetical protein